jgi:hypothetical protein
MRERRSKLFTVTIHNTGTLQTTWKSDGAVQSLVLGYGHWPVLGCGSKVPNRSLPSNVFFGEPSPLERIS